MTAPGEGEPGGFPAGIPSAAFRRVLRRLQVSTCFPRRLPAVNQPLKMVRIQHSAQHPEAGGVVAIPASDGSVGEGWETTRDLHYSSGARVTLRAGRPPSVLYKVCGQSMHTPCVSRARTACHSVV